MKAADESIILDFEDEAILDDIWFAATTTEKHLSGKHNQQSHAGGKGGGASDVDIDTQISQAKQAVYARMKEAKASGDYSGMSQLRRRVKDLEAAKAAGGAAPTVEESKAAEAATKREMDAFDPGDMYSSGNISARNNAEGGEEFRKVLGRGNETRAREIARLTGAPDDSQVYIEKSDTGDGVMITVSNRRFWEEGRFTLFKGPDGPELRVESLDLEDGLPKGTGTSMVYRMVRESRKLGVTTISLTALRDNISNGYYSWPRMGFDGALPETTRSKLRGTEFRHARMVSDLMKTRAGRKWWRENGETIALTFDTSPGSFESTILETYIGELLGK